MLAIRSLSSYLPLALCLVAISARAETGKVLVQVQDSHDKTIAGIGVAIEGFGGSRLTDAGGKG